MYRYIKNILIISFFITSSLYACNRGDNCFIPEADAGQNKNYYIGSTVTLDGSGSYDPEGENLTYNWTYSYFPTCEQYVSTVEDLSDPSALIEECENASSILEFIENICLSVYGFESDTLQSDCEVNGINIAIYNSCIASQYAEFYPCDDFLDDEPPASMDCTMLNDSFIVLTCDLAVDSIDFTEDLTGINPSFVVGDYAHEITVSLIVNDGDYNSNPDEVIITVVDVNQAPVIDVETSISVNKNSEFMLDASGTQDDSSLTGTMIFSWDDVSDVFTCNGEDSSILTCISPDVSSDETYTINLTVSDGVDSDVQAISILVVANQKPIAIPGSDLEVKLGTTFDLDGSLSYDPEGASLTYLWTIPNNFSIVSGSVNESQITVEYDLNTIPVENEHIFSLTVNDSSDDSDANIGSGIFISEYCEHPDDTDGRYFEIYNPTSQDISLDNYELLRLNNGGQWSNDGSNTIFSLSGYTIESGKAIAITRKDETNSDAAELIDYQNINYIHWSNFNPGGDDAIGIAYNGQLIDAIGGATDPGSAWDAAGYSEVTKDAQIIRKNSVLGGNINDDCLSTTNQGWVETQSCWNLSAGTTIENSEWVYYEDPDDENPDIPDVDSWNNAGYHYCATCDNFLTVTLTDNDNPVALPSSDFIYNEVGDYWSPSWQALEGSTIILDASLSSDPEGVDLSYSWTSSDVSFSDDNIVNPSIVIPSLSEINIVLVVSDGPNSDSINIKIDVASINTDPNPVAEFASMVLGDEIVDQQNLTQYYEGYTITFSALSSTDDTYTGNLTYSWVLSPADIDLTGAETSEVSFIVPEYIGQDKNYSLTLTVNDGSLDSTVETNFVLEARMPIIGLAESEIDGSENTYVRLDASSTTNPDGNINDLEFSWKPSSQISGYCSSDNSISCEDDLCGGTCVDDASIAFAFIDKSIGVNTAYTITVDAENNSDLESEEAQIDINVIAQYPVANPGIDQTYTCGTVATLYGMRSSDPQEEVVSFGQWESDTSWDDEIISNVIAFYDESMGLSPSVGYTFTWSYPVGVTLSDINTVNPTFTIPCDDPLVGQTLTFDLLVNDVNDSFESKSVSTDVDIVQNEAPVAVIGNYRIYNEGDIEELYLYGHSSESSEDPDTLRALAGQSFTLYGENSFDNTEYQDLTYTWVAPDGVALSDANDMNPTFTVPLDLCSDGVSFTQKDCCNNNDGTWSANQICLDGSATWISESEVLSFSLVVSDGDLSSSVSIPMIYGSYTEPTQPSLFGRSENKKIYLYWDNLAEQSIDNLSKYADFQGYKVYRSTDYGQTWGDAIFNDGEVVGWQPYAQYDLSAEQDSTYCLYKNAFSDCDKDNSGNSVPSGVSTYRYDDISDYVTWYDGYYWQNLGSNSGLTQSFTDEDVVDGVDYTYSITAYDGGVRPDTLQYGHFGELSNTTWDPDVWNNNKPLYTFKEYVEADSFYFYRMDYTILESYVENGKHMYKLDPPSEWLDNGVVNQSDIDDGVRIWETNTVWPISNPDELPTMYSQETPIGLSLSDKNFVTVSPGSYASNVSFPEENDLDDFIAADCQAIGDGSRFYEIVNESDLEDGFVKLEIQASPGMNIFEGYYTEEPCLYAYKVELVSESGAPDTYQSVSSTVYSLNDNEGNTNDLYDEVCAENVNLKPGAIANCEWFSYIEPDYLIECHELSYLDDPNFASNWTNFFDGVRMRFDNSLREEPKGTDGAALKDIYSYPDSTIAQVLSEDDSFYGKIVLKYAQNAFSKKPSYEYELELSETFADTAFFNTTGGSANDFNHLEECGTTFGTLLPFRIKNITTGDYVKVSHSDNGIWNDVATEIPSWFTTPLDNSTHPGSKDCIWSPGEWITFWDDVQVGDSETTEEVITFKLEFSFNQFMVSNYKSEVCPNVVDYDATTTYPLGSCVSSDGHVWYASSDIRPSDNNGQGYSPNEWYDDDDSMTELNDNPWEIIYPWEDNDKVVIKPQKWFVDGDYWIADMSMLGASEVVTENDISNISVVPNPYIISSRFNESENGNRIRFTNLPQQCTINIYTISGEFVKSINHNDDFKGSVFWNLKNTSGENVAPGLYIYMLETDNGLSKVGKFAVVR